MSQPSITVVIPTHNRAATLTRLLHCVQQQDQEDFECIVVDDGSTAEILAAYADIWKTLDDRFVLHARPRLAGRTSGPSATRNTGITLARAPIVAFCDDDDLWSRNDHLSVAV